MTNYSIFYGDSSNDIIHVSYEINDITESVLFLQLPAWRPGRYELGNFAQNVFPLFISDDKGNELKYKKIKKDRWRVDCEGVSAVTVKYDYAAVIKNAGGTFKTDESLIITPVNCLLYAESRIFEDCKVAVSVPDGFELASSLEGSMIAKDYYELAASPLVYSKNIEKKIIEVENINFHLCFEGKMELNWGKIIPDFTKFIKCQLDLFGSFPEPDYYFLNLIFPEKHYHGVEHLKSTLIALGPDSKFNDSSFYQNLLGISSHELFHFWNICRIRPLEMMPYNYTKENYFDTGYIAEGVTTYYGDYLLGRSGSFTEETTLEELSGTLNRHLLNVAREKVSVAESSVDLWLDGYKKGVTGRKVSIYAKGAMIAWVLDLWIRETTSNIKSLDDVMRLMWGRFGVKRIGYTTADYKKCIEDVTGVSATWYVEELIYGVVPIENHLKGLLNSFGLELSFDEGTSSSFYKRFGLEIKKKDHVFVISKLDHKSDELKEFAVGDTVLTLENHKMNEELLVEYMTEEYLTVGVKRGGRIISRSITAGKFTSEKSWSVRKIKNASSLQEENYKAWMQG